MEITRELKLSAQETHLSVSYLLLAVLYVIYSPFLLKKPKYKMINCHNKLLHLEER